MKKLVYLAGPIEKCSDKEISQWRLECSNAFLENIITINPYRAESDSDSSETKKRILMKNYMDTKSCDLILAYLPKEINDRRPSYGTVFEIAWGYSLQKPVIIVSDDDEVHNHPLLATAGALFYNFTDAIDYINILLGEYQKTTATTENLKRKMYEKTFINEVHLPPPLTPPASNSRWRRQLGIFRKT